MEILSAFDILRLAMDASSRNAIMQLKINKLIVYRKRKSKIKVFSYITRN